MQVLRLRSTMKPRCFAQDDGGNVMAVMVTEAM
jgi:hypothetical protein